MRALIAIVLLCPNLALAQELRAIELPSGAPIEASTTIEELAMVRIGVWRAGQTIEDEERPALAAAMDAAYERMNARGAQPSIFLASHRAQRASAFDALIAEAPAPRVGVVFLHGSGGNFTWPCWAIAEVVVAQGGVIVCPSGVGARAAWASGEGPAIVSAAIEALRARGVERVVLAGLSSGGVGASRLMRGLRGRIDGVILISGATSQRTELPALLVHGTGDTMVPVYGARALARRSPAATLIELPGRHFVLAEHTTEVQGHIRDWLTAPNERAGHRR
jgi:pimeloyl-ACP methyl ester carboxylesterase